MMETNINVEKATPCKVAHAIRGPVAQVSGVAPGTYVNMGLWVPGQGYPTPYVHIELTNGQRFRITITEVGA